MKNAHSNEAWISWNTPMAMAPRRIPTHRQHVCLGAGRGGRAAAAAPTGPCAHAQPHALSNAAHTVAMVTDKDVRLRWRGSHSSNAQNVRTEVERWGEGGGGELEDHWRWMMWEQVCIETLIWCGWKCDELLIGYHGSEVMLEKVQRKKSMIYKIRDASYNKGFGENLQLWSQRLRIVTEMKLTKNLGDFFKNPQWSL